MDSTAKLNETWETEVSWRRPRRKEESAGIPSDFNLPEELSENGFLLLGLMKGKGKRRKGRKRKGGKMRLREQRRERQETGKGRKGEERERNRHEKKQQKDEEREESQRRSKGDSSGEREAEEEEWTYFPQDCDAWVRLGGI